MSIDIEQQGKAYGAGSREAGRKREEVLDIAAECFLANGYDGASINAMSRESGISKESIYRYFSSKKELFEAVIGRELNEYQRKLDRLDTILGAMDLREALLVVAETSLSVLTSDKTLALRRLVFEEAVHSPEVGRHYYRIGPGRACSTLRKLLAEHDQASRFDADALSNYFVAMASCGIMLERQCRISDEPTRAEVEQLAARIVDDFIAAFLRPAG